jgi:hypothetical protein
MTDAILDGETCVADSEPLSPELVLVDPQLAVFARARLAAAPVDAPPRTEQSEVPASATDSVPAGRPAERPLAVSLEQAAEEPTQRSWEAQTRLRRVFKAAVVVVLVVLGLASGLMLLLPRLLDEPSGTVGSVAPAGTPSGSHAERAERPGAPQRPTPRGATPTRTPARQVFAWVPTARASHYKVEFFQRGAKVFEAFPTSPRIALPARWVYRGRRFELAPGRYLWSVRPGYGARRDGGYGRIIVRSTWVYPLATAG